MRVRIYRPSKSAAQSGYALTHQWVVEAENAMPRFAEPIMGWMSSKDLCSELRGRLRFPSEADALAFVKGRGWSAVVGEPSVRHIRPRNYLHNFRIIRSQDQERASYSHKTAN
ncbi:MAG: NADH dehydrogenase ubiquinone Fe-S protein 4 [Bdellovibrionales bacterium]